MSEAETHVTRPHDPHRHDDAIDKIEKAVVAQEAVAHNHANIRGRCETFASDCELTFGQTAPGQRVLEVLRAFADRSEPSIDTLYRLSGEEQLKLTARRKGFSDLVRYIEEGLKGNVEYLVRGP